MFYMGQRKSCTRKQRKRAMLFVTKEIITTFSIFIYRGRELPTVLCAFLIGSYIHMFKTNSFFTPFHFSTPKPNWLSPAVYSMSVVKCIIIHCVRMLMSFAVAVQTLSRVRHIAASWAAVCKASLSFTVSWNGIHLFYGPTLTSAHETTKETITLTVGKEMFLLFNTLGGFLIAFLPRSRHFFFFFNLSLCSSLLF